MSYVSIIESSSTGHWYYGSTDNPAERLKYHNNGWNRSTRGRGPWRHIFLREFPSPEEARAFESHLKKLRRKSYILKKYAAYFFAGEGAQPGLPRRDAT